MTATQQQTEAVLERLRRLRLMGCRCPPETRACITCAELDEIIWSIDLDALYVKAAP